MRKYQTEDAANTLMPGLVLSHLDYSNALLTGMPKTDLIMSTPLGGGYIIFAFSAVRCPASRMVSAHLKEKY